MWLGNPYTVPDKLHAGFSQSARFPDLRPDTSRLRLDAAQGSDLMQLQFASLPLLCDALQVT
jgi:hypothetical protein